MAGLPQVCLRTLPEIRFFRFKNVPVEVLLIRMEGKHLFSFFKKGILRKLLGVLIPLVVLTMGTATYLNVSDAHNSLFNEINHNLLSTVETHGKVINNWLENFGAQVKLLAVTEQVRSMEWSIQEEFLTEIVSENAQFEDVLVANVNGEYRDTSGGHGTIGDRDYFQRALQGETVISDQPIVSRVSGNTIIPAASPILDTRGRVVGVLTVTAPFSIIQEMVDEIRPGRTGYAYIVDKQGLFIAHPDENLVLNDFIFAQESDRLRAVGEEMVAGKTGFDEYDFRGSERYVSYTPIPITGWSLSTLVPVEEISQPVDEMTKRAILVILVSIVFIVLAITVVTRAIVQPVNDLAEQAEIMASGDLTVRFDVVTQDEVGVLAKALRKLRKDMGNMLTEVANAAKGLQNASNSLSASTEETAASVQEIAGTASQFASTVQMIADTTKSMDATAKEISETSSEGDEVISNGVKETEELRSTIADLSKGVNALGTRSNQVGKIVEVISGIAEQTNLLALNAAIEAARAGENGRGFAVVSEEIRELAEQSSASASEISTLIGEIQLETSSIVEEMGEGFKQTQQTEEVVRAGSEVLRGIFESIEGIVNQIQNVAQGTEELNSGSQQLAASTEEQSASSEQVASSAQQLNSMSSTLQDLVARFKVDENQDLTVNEDTSTYN